MPRPTKFEIMRDRRWAADIRIAAEQQGLKLVTHREARSDVPAAPVVPTMEIDGVRYREHPITADTFSECHGCAFEHQDDAECSKACRTGAQVFGASCSLRSVVYLRTGA